MLGTDYDLSECFKKHYHLWLEQEVFSVKIDWDKLLEMKDKKQDNSKSQNNVKAHDNLKSQDNSRSSQGNKPGNNQDNLRGNLDNSKTKQGDSKSNQENPKNHIALKSQTKPIIENNPSENLQSKTNTISKENSKGTKENPSKKGKDC